MSAAAAREDALPSCWTVSGSGSVLKVTLASRGGSCSVGREYAALSHGANHNVSRSSSNHIKVSDSPPMSREVMNSPT